MMRNSFGWNGRRGKAPDSCYGFWNIATINNMGFMDLIDQGNSEKFLFCHQKDLVQF